MTDAIYGIGQLILGILLCLLSIPVFLLVTVGVTLAWITVGEDRPSLAYIQSTTKDVFNGSR